MLKCLELTAYRKALVNRLRLDPVGVSKHRVDYVHCTSFSKSIAK